MDSCLEVRVRQRGLLFVITMLVCLLAGPLHPAQISQGATPVPGTGQQGMGGNQSARPAAKALVAQHECLADGPRSGGGQPEYSRASGLGLAVPLTRSLQKELVLDPPAERPGAEEFAYVARFRPRCTVILDAIPALPQFRKLSCEAAAIRMVLAARGISVSEEEILRRMGSNPNPHKGFRGNVDGDGHRPDLQHYGAYAEVVARVLSSLSARPQAVYHLSDDGLRREVGSGRAVIVWMTSQKAPRVVQRRGYRLVDGEHVLVVVGLDLQGRFLVHDPWGARPESERPGTFFTPSIPYWDLFERMAVIVSLDDREAQEHELSRSTAIPEFPVHSGWPP